MRVRIAGRLGSAVFLGCALTASFACNAGSAFPPSGPILSPVGPVGSGDRVILLDATALMLAIVVPTMLATMGFAWWFRASNTRATYRPNWTYSGRVELLVWSIPTLVIFFLGGVTWIGSHLLDPFRPLPPAMKPLEIEVVALDWKWLFIYPQDGVASINRLIVPVGQPLHFRITSASVFNVFFIPRLGSQIYAMNGMTTQLNLRADEPGRFLGLSAQFSGDGFSDMRFDAIAEPQAQFAQWIAQARAQGPVLNTPAYRALSKQSRPTAPYTYRNVDTGLFDAVAAQKLPPGEGPHFGKGGPGAAPRGGT
jgi:cytochrome o ubiquinol oxidase subunit 2